MSRSADLVGAVASVFANVHYDGDNETHQSRRSWRPEHPPIRHNRLPADFGPN